MGKGTHVYLKYIKSILLSIFDHWSQESVPDLVLLLYSWELHPTTNIFNRLNHLCLLTEEKQSMALCVGKVVNLITRNLQITKDIIRKQRTSGKGKINDVQKLRSVLEPHDKSLTS